MIRGLKPYSAYKNSGVPWLGEVPAHWVVTRIKRIAQLNPSKSEAESTLAANADVTFLPMERVSADGRIDTSEIRPASAVWNGFTYFRKDDVLVAKITPCFENGKGACLESLPTSIGFGSTEFTVLRARSNVVPQFLYRLTKAAEFRPLGADAMTGAAGQQRVPTDFVSNYVVAVPPPDEQSAIVRFLGYADRRINRLIRAYRRLAGASSVARDRKSSLLNEYRTRLFADVVTGKLDVRAAAAHHLPDEIEEQETIEETQTLDEAEAAQVEESSEAALEYTAAGIG